MVEQTDGDNYRIEGRRFERINNGLRISHSGHRDIGGKFFLLVSNKLRQSVFINCHRILPRPSTINTQDRSAATGDNYTRLNQDIRLCYRIKFTKLALA